MREFLTQQQLSHILDSVRSLRDWLLIRVQYETGCTVSELIHIKREDIRAGRIKTGDRTARVSTDLTRRCKEYLGTHGSDYLFPSRQSPHLTVKRIQQITKKLLKDCNIRVDKKTPHLFRYTHIIHAHEQGISMPAIMQQTGLGELRISQIINECTEPAEDEYRRMFT